MIKNEFETLAGYEVSAEMYYNVIEPMYNACPLSKQDFVQLINKKEVALTPLNKIYKNMCFLANTIKVNCTHFTDYETQEKLDQLADEYTKRLQAYGYYIETAEYQHSTCYYPIKVIIYDKKYQNVRVLDLATNN